MGGEGGEGMASNPCSGGFKVFDLTITHSDGFVIVIVIVIIVAVKTVMVMVGREADTVRGVEVVLEVAFDEVLLCGIKFTSFFRVMIDAFVLSSVASHGRYMYMVYYVVYSLYIIIVYIVGIDTADHLTG